MHHRSLALALALGLASSFTLADDAIVATVNGQPIPKTRMDYVIKIQTAQGKPEDEEMRKQVKEALINREILTQEALKKELDKSPELLAQVEMARQEFLIRALFEQFAAQNGPSDEEVTAEYDKVKNEMTDGGKKMEYLARHILIKNEKAAKAVLASLNKAKGKNFEQLAKTKSEDSGSKTKGGSLDWNDGSGLVKEFAEAMAKLNKGEYTQQLVKTGFGYHIIRLDDQRPIAFPALEEVKDKLQQQIMIGKRDKFIADLKAGAKVE